MAAITWSDVTNIAPELSTVAVAAQTDILAYVNVALNVELFGGESHPMVKLLRIYLAAHFGTVTKSGGSGALGPVIAESGGGLSRQYGSSVVNGSDPLFDKTNYGQTFRLLVRSSPLSRGPGVAS